MLYTNHSCEPNIAIRGQIVFVAMREIAAGEELTHDWATTDDLDYEMACRCGRPTCRGTVTGKRLDEAGAAAEVPGVVLLVPRAEDRGALGSREEEG